MPEGNENTPALPEAPPGTCGSAEWRESLTTPAGFAPAGQKPSEESLALHRGRPIQGVDRDTGEVVNVTQAEFARALDERFNELRQRVIEQPGNVYLRKELQDIIRYKTGAPGAELPKVFADPSKPDIGHLDPDTAAKADALHKMHEPAKSPAEYKIDVGRADPEVVSEVVPLETYQRALFDMGLDKGTGSYVLQSLVGSFDHDGNVVDAEFAEHGAAERFTKEFGSQEAASEALDTVLDYIRQHAPYVLEGADELEAWVLMNPSVVKRLYTHARVRAGRF